MSGRGADEALTSKNRHPRGQAQAKRMAKPQPSQPLRHRYMEITISQAYLLLSAWERPHSISPIAKGLDLGISARDEIQNARKSGNQSRIVRVG